MAISRKHQLLLNRQKFTEVRGMTNVKNQHFGNNMPTNTRCNQIIFKMFSIL